MMTDTEIYNQKLANLNFRAKLRNVINTNQEVMDAQDNNMVKPILDEEVYKHTAKTNKSTKQQWDILSKQIKSINNSRYELPSRGSRENSPIPSKEEVKPAETARPTRIPVVPSHSNNTATRNAKLEEEISQLKSTIKSLTMRLSEKDTERKDIIDDFQAKEVRMMKTRQEEIKKLTKRYESKIHSLQHESEARVVQLVSERDQLTSEIENVKLQTKQQHDELKRVVEALSSENERLRAENKKLVSKGDALNDDQMKFNHSLMIENKELKRTIENMQRQNGIRYDVVQDDSDEEEEEIENIPRNDFKNYVPKTDQHDGSVAASDLWLPNTPKTALAATYADLNSTEIVMNRNWGSVSRDTNQLEQILSKP